MPTDITPTIDPTKLTREDKLNLIYRHKHSDSKGKIKGVRTILTYRNGTVLVDLGSLTDDEIAYSLPYAIKQEEKRIARKLQTLTDRTY